MREQQLLRAEAAGIRIGILVAQPEERHLESHRSALGLELSGHVPPLDAMFRMRTGIAREHEHLAGNDCRKVGSLNHEGQDEHEESNEGLHASSFTASTASLRTAKDALTRAPKAHRAMIAASSAASAPSGQCTSRLQWNDWRFTTYTSTRLMAAPETSPMKAPSAPVAAPSRARMRSTSRRVRPRKRSTPNSPRRDHASAAKLLVTPARPIAIAMASRA